MYLFRNNATSILRQDTPAGSITLTLPSGEGDRFPAPVAPDLATVTIEDRRTGQLEICTLTARSGDVLTVTRGTEGTSALNFYAGATVSNRMTAGTLAGIQSAGTFFYGGPYDVAPIPGPLPGSVGVAGQILPDPIPPGTQYFNTQNNTIYVWDGTIWFNYSNALPLDGHLPMIGDLQMAHYLVDFNPTATGNTIIEGGGGAIINTMFDAMDGNVLQLRRKTVPGAAFSTLLEGQIELNVADLQTAMGPIGGGVALPMIAVRYFTPTAKYLAGDHVINAGVLLRAAVPNGPGAFNGANWVSGSGGLPEAPIDTNPYFRKDANWAVATLEALGGISEAPGDGAMYARVSGTWGAITWTSLAGKPATFPPSVHTHTIAQVTGLQTTLDGKASITDLTTEAGTRATNDAALQGNIDTNTTAIATEASTRGTADTTLTNNLATEVTNRTNADTTLQTNINAKLSDAPSDGKQYTRKDATWSQVVATYIGDTPLASPAAGTMWWESDSGVLYLRYDDGSSQQWVQINAIPSVANLVNKTGDTMSGQLLLPTPASGPAAAPKSYVDAGDAAVVAGVPAQVTSGANAAIVTAQQAVPSVLAHRAGSGNVAMTTANTIYKIPMVIMVGQIGGWSINGTGALVCPKKGVYMLHASAAITTTAAAMILEVGMMLNAAAVFFTKVRHYSAGAVANQWILNCSRLQFLDVGDTVTLAALSSVAAQAQNDIIEGTHLEAFLVTAVP